MTDEKNRQATDDAMIDMLKTMTEVDPPVDFVSGVMEGLVPKRPSLWMRFRLWMHEPWHVAVTPARAVPAIAVIVLLVVGGFWSLQGDPSNPASSTVQFTMTDVSMAARNVAVIGSFNEWSADKTQMRYDASRKAWVVEVDLLPGDYEYVFLVNGKTVVADPQAAMTRDDGFGNRNSIVFVNGLHEQTL